MSADRPGLAFWRADTTVPISELSTGDLLRAAAHDAPDTIAIREVVPDGSPALAGADASGRSWTYAQLLDDGQACARWLLTRFSPSERIVVWAPNIPEWIVLQYAAALSGLVLVTANPALRSGELRYVLEQSRAAGVFFTSAFRGTDMAALVADATTDLPGLREQIRFDTWPALMDEARELHTELPTVHPGDAAQIQYTSGTTGFPKGVLLAHRGLVTNARYIGLRGHLERGGIILTAMPLFHTAGCGMSVLGAAHLRSTLVLLQMFEPALMLRTIATERPDTFLGVPTMHIALLDHPHFAVTDVSSVQVAISGGAPVPSDLIRRVEKAYGCGFATVYGQTELSPILTQTSPTDSTADKASTAGQPLWNVDVQVVDPVDGRTVGPDEQGEVCARGYQQMLEYFEMPEQTAKTVDADGWVHTGDLGTLDERGYLRITGRLKDMIIRGGENMFPAEIEQVLFSHPDVASVVVVGLPDPFWGERIAAVVQPRDQHEPPDAAALHALCREKLAPAKAPADWYVTPELPLTGSGKVQKFLVREVIAEGGYQRLR